MHSALSVLCRKLGVAKGKRMKILCLSTEATGDLEVDEWCSGQATVIHPRSYGREQNA